MRARLVVAIGASVLLAACGSSTAPSSQPPPAESPYQMVISPSGVLTPSEMTIPGGSRVLFINNHSRPHQMASDPHPEHNDCPEMDPVGILAPGQRRETSNFVTVRTCGVHDHEDSDNKSLWGRIIVR
jgi:plastocyanin